MKKWLMVLFSWMLLLNMLGCVISASTGEVRVGVALTTESTRPTPVESPIAATNAAADPIAYVEASSPAIAWRSGFNLKAAGAAVEEIGGWFVNAGKGFVGLFTGG